MWCCKLNKSNKKSEGSALSDSSYLGQKCPILCWVPELTDYIDPKLGMVHCWFDIGIEYCSRDLVSPRFYSNRSIRTLPRRA